VSSAAAPVKKSHHKKKEPEVVDGEISLPPELTPAQKKLAMQLSGLYATIGIFVTRFDTYDGMLLISESEKRAQEVIMVARHHKGVLAIIERIVTGNDYVSLLMGHGVMLYAILANHGRVQADPVFLHQYGYSKEQVLAPLIAAQMAQGQMNGNGAAVPANP
jgi:hypothetical protein